MIYMVYGITDCPSCIRAYADLMDKDIEYVFVNCDFSKSYRAYLKSLYNWSTFPIVILNDGEDKTLIGGYDELTRHLAAQER